MHDHHDHEPPLGPDGLPAYLTRPTSPDHWDRPTAWLLGTQMFGALKKWLLSTMHRGFDLRDWMTAAPIDLRSPAGVAPGDDDPTECWLDFFADTGDSPRLVYWLARLIQAEHLDVGGRRLPRGRALLLGGDTGYPVADRVTLVERVCAPFVWARQRVANPPDRVALLAIPGNHDYYDTLDGFARQFRPSCGVPALDSEPARNRLPLDLPGYRREQQASYYSATLPFGWQLWGLDTELGIDARQLAYFKGLSADPPEKLIVVTSRPVVVRGACATDRDHVAVACKHLRIAPAFRDPSLIDNDPAGRLRLDLSGDVHMYQRYYGQTAGPTSIPGEPSAAASAPGASACAAEHDRTAPSAQRYAAVVCGLGGAFHHPSQVTHGSLRHAAAFPGRDASAKAIGDVLLRPLAVFRAGAAGVMGMLVASLMYVFANYRPSGGPPPGPRILLHRLFFGGPPPEAPSPLQIPRMLWSGSPRPGDLERALDSLLGVLGSVGLYAVWAVLLVLALTWTGRMRSAMWRAPADWPAAWLYRLLQCRPGRWLARTLGIRPRALHVALLTGLAWLTVASFTLVLRHYSPIHWDGLGRRHTLGNLFVIAFLTGTCVLGTLGGRTVRRKLVFGGVGLVHGVVQLAAPYLWIAYLDSHLVYGSALLVGLWLAARGLGHISLRLREPARRAIITGFGVALAFAALLPLALSDGQGAFWHPGLVPVAALLGGFFTCQLLGWYLLVTLQWHAHGNEAGSVARIDRFAAFLRIRLTATGAEVWAISPTATDDGHGDFDVEPTLVDHFTIGAP